jgi:rRNA maturation endonuclease Nob1
MGFFERVGRQVEQFKQTATEAAQEDQNYQCRACESRFYSEHEQCPDCGAQEVTLLSEE